MSWPPDAQLVRRPVWLSVIVRVGCCPAELPPSGLPSSMQLDEASQAGLERSPEPMYLPAGDVVAYALDASEGPGTRTDAALADDDNRYRAPR